MFGENICVCVCDRRLKVHSHYADRHGSIAAWQKTIGFLKMLRRRPHYADRHGSMLPLGKTNRFCPNAGMSTHGSASVVKMCD